MPNPFNLTKLAETIEMFAEIFKKLHLNLSKKKLKNAQFQFLSSCHNFPLFDFRLKSHYWENFVFFPLSSFFSHHYYLPKTFYLNGVFHSFHQHVAIWAPNTKLKNLSPTPPKHLTWAPSDHSLFKGPGSPNPLSHSTLRDALLAAMVAHKEPEGNPLPTPTDPMQLLSGQTELPTLPLWRCALCTQIWQLRMAFGPLLCLQRMLHYCTWGLPWHGVPYNLPS